MEFEPVDSAILRRSAILPYVFRYVAKKHGLVATDLDTLFQIHSLTTDLLKGVKLNKVVGLKSRARQTVYVNVSALEQSGFIVRRNRVKTAPITIYITDSGYALINFFLLALKRIEREKFGARVDRIASAKGGRISRKPKKQE